MSEKDGCDGGFFIPLGQMPYLAMFILLLLAGLLATCFL